jgi:hypothetical protein
MTESVPAPEYIAARIALLDALQALAEHRSAVIVVGAQAVYVRTSTAGILSAPFTTDGDLALDITQLGDAPRLGELMEQAHFRLKPNDTGNGIQPGQWQLDVTVDGAAYTPQVDLIVPAGSLDDQRSHRGARLLSHGNTAAMRTSGLEAALIDHDPIAFTALVAGDDRSYRVEVAGTAALLVAKIHKIGDRLDDTTRPNRQADKDALDVLRLVRATPAAVMADRLDELRQHPRCAAIVDEAITRLPTMFGRPRAPGVEMAQSAAATDIPAAVVAAQLTTYVNSVLDILT